jgi:hypothetical protein
MSDEFLWGKAAKPKRKPLAKSEWESIKLRQKNKCLMCDVSERTCGGLVKAHVKAHSKGGTQIIALCSNCHKKMHRKLCKKTGLRKIGIPPEKYKYYLPKE